MQRLIILILFCFSAALLAQTPNWTGVKETNINVGSAYSVDIFTNRDGNHIIVQESNNLKYYKMNINGQAGSPINIETSAVVSPSISGDADNIYIVYGIGSQVRIRRSINGGSSWSLWTSFNLSTSASYMESVFSNGNLHVTYLESSIIKYRYRNYTGGSWIGPFTVSTGENGLYPRIITSSQDNMVYFLYEKQNTEIGKWRWYNVGNNTWSNVFEGYNFGNTYDMYPAGFNIVGSNLIMYFASFEPNFIGSYEYFFNKIVVNRFNNTLIYPRAQNERNMTNRVYSTTTSDNIGHTAFYYLLWNFDNIEAFSIWRSKSDNGDKTDIIYEYQDYQFNQPMHINVSSAGNEVHVIWKDQFGNNNGNNLRYKYDDQNPFKPQNPALASSIPGGYGFVKFSWTANSEPDLNYYEVWRKIPQISSNWILIATSTNPYYIDTEYLYTNPVGDFVLYYKVRAKDIGNHYSEYSNEVSCQAESANKVAVLNKDLFEYSLKQNYPNPFNPSTKITYTLSEDAKVQIKVYDMLGTEIAELVNETKPVGYYEATFDASNLSSGVYIYRITALSGDRILFSQSKQMILLR